MQTSRRVVTWRSWNYVRNWKQGSGMSWCPPRRRWRYWSQWWGVASGREKELVCSFSSLMPYVWLSPYPRQTPAPANRSCHTGVGEKNNVSVCYVNHLNMWIEVGEQPFFSWWFIRGADSCLSRLWEADCCSLFLCVVLLYLYFSEKTFIHFSVLKSLGWLTSFSSYGYGISQILCTLSRVSTEVILVKYPW